MRDALTPWRRPAWSWSRAVLVAVFFQVLVVFAITRYSWWREHGPARPLTLTGEGLCVRGDGLGYYAWLRSLLIEGDWDFDNEFDGHNPMGDWLPTDRTGLGRRGNPWSVGPACTWAVAVVPVHLGLLALGQWAPWPADGYSYPYQLAVAAVALLAAALGLGLLYAMGRRYARPLPAALAAAFLTLGTSILFYWGCEVSWAHGLGTGAAALFVWYWLRTYGATNRGRWLMVGLLLGITALMRWQLATLALLPAGEWALALPGSWRDRAGAGRWLGLDRLALAGLAAAATLLPQAVAWHAVNGHWIGSGHVLASNWTRPDLYAVLFSTNRSLFYWTPLTILPFAGYLLALLPGRPRPGEGGPRPAGPRGPLLLLPAAFAVQVYVLASILPGVVLGASFGFRYLTESLVLLVPGLALLLDAPSWRGRLAGMASWLLLMWTLLVLAQYHRGLLSHEAGADLPTLLAGAARLLQTRTAYSVAMLLGGAALLPPAWRLGQHHATQSPGRTRFLVGHPPASRREAREVG